MPNGRCYLHGGKAPTGPALPQFKHGRYSKDLPTRLLATYEATRNDPDLLNLTDELGVLDSRLVDLLRGMQTDAAASVNATMWADIVDLIERRRRLADSELKRRVALAGVITKEQAAVMLGRVLDAFDHATEMVVDLDERRRVQTDFRSRIGVMLAVESRLGRNE